MTMRRCFQLLLLLTLFVLCLAGLALAQEEPYIRSERHFDEDELADSRQADAWIQPVQTEQTEQAAQEPAKDLYVQGVFAPEDYDMPYAIMVDRENQIVTVVERNEMGVYSKVVDQYICSTGASRSWTPEGVHYLTKSTRKEWRYFPTSNCYIRYAVRIYGNYFFHSVLYNRESLSSLNSKSYKQLGTRASHGCIRMLDEDAHWLSDNCAAGTLVWVMDGEQDEALRQSLLPSPYVSTTERDFGKYDRLDQRQAA